METEESLVYKGQYIEGVAVRSLSELPTEGGSVLHMLRNDSPEFTSFGEIYFSVVDAGAVKAWKCHKQQTQRFAVPYGEIRIVLYDDRPKSLTRGTLSFYLLGRPDNYNLLTIPPNIWYGFTSLHNATAILANCADIPHDPHESKRLPMNAPQIPYVW